jgi:secondary thiamine-phosphate synthase enzyme
MKIEDCTVEVDTGETCDIVDITGIVAQRLKRSGVQNGTVTLFVVGSTGGLTTVEYEPGLVADLQEFYEKIAPANLNYHHEQTWHDGNGYSHVRASLLKPDLTIPVISGEMTLGTWQQIVLINFDNRSRRRRVAMQVMGS